MRQCVGASPPTCKMRLKWCICYRHTLHLSLIHVHCPPLPPCHSIITYESSVTALTQWAHCSVTCTRRPDTASWSSWPPLVSTLWSIQNDLYLGPVRCFATDTPPVWWTDGRAIAYTRYSMLSRIKSIASKYCNISALKVLQYHMQY